LTVIATLFAPLVFLGGTWVALLGVAIWGLGMGVHESIIPAAVAPMVSPEHRASAYGLFTAGYGIFWFLGSAVIGFLYGISFSALITFSVVLQLAAVPLFLVVARQTSRARQNPRKTE
jgi:MFS family permease